MPTLTWRRGSLQSPGFGLPGQACNATSRVTVEKSVAEAFTASLVEKAKAIVVSIIPVENFDETLAVATTASMSG